MFKYTDENLVVVSLDLIENMSGGLITVPAFAGTRKTVEHFFGTRLQPPIFDGKHVVSLSDDSRWPPGVEAIVSVKQVHGTDALVVDQPPQDGMTFPGGRDALLTNQPGVLLTIRTADCVPVLFHDPRRQVVSAVHAGWRGAVAGIIPKTLALMHKRFQSDISAIRMVIGPSAGPCCYEIDGPVLKPLQNGYPYWRRVVRRTQQDKALLDLKELVRRQARSAGVNSASIWMVGLCTICHPKVFYSYRRDGIVKETMVSGIMLAPAADRPIHHSLPHHKSPDLLHNT